MESLTYFFITAGMFIFNDLSKDTENSWIKSTLGGLPTEIAGSVVDRTYELAKNKLKEHFPRIIRDNRKTLYKSVRNAQLKAVRDVCNAFRAEIKGDNSEKYTLEYIKAVEKYLNDEESKLTHGDFVDINLSDEEIGRIMSPEKRAAKIPDEVGNALVKEFPKAEVLPPRFVEMLKNGWSENGVSHSLPERFEVHFNAELANPETANVLFKKTLSGIRFTLEELLEGSADQTEAIKNLAETIAKNTDRLEKLGYRILYKESGEVKGFEYLGEKLDRIEDKIDRLLEADKALTPAEREAKNQAIIEDYLSMQMKDYPIGEIVGEVYPHDKFFVDRDEEKAKIPQWLMSGEKMVVIRGVSGDGKTALMTEVLRGVMNGNEISHPQVRGILTFYFRDFSGKFLDVNLLDICKKADARLAQNGIKKGFAAQYEEFRKSAPLDIPVQLITHLCHALNALGGIWIVFDNFESALQNNRVKDAEIETFIQKAAAYDNLHFLVTSQILPVIEGIDHIRQCSIADLPADYAKKFLWSKGLELKENGNDCGLAEARSEQFDLLFEKLLPSPIALISFTAYLETLCATEGKVFDDVLADDTLYLGFEEFDADDKNKGASVLIRRQFELLGATEQLVLKALSIFPKPVEFPVLQAILPLTLDKQAILAILRANSLVRKDGRNLYELLPLPKKVIAKQFEQTDKNSHIAFNLKAAMFYRSIHKPVADCYTLEDFDTYFKEIEHYYQAGFYENIVQIINQIMPKTTPLGMMNETLEKSRKIENKLPDHSEAKADNYLNIGLSLRNLGKLPEAIAEYDKAIEILKDLVENQGRIELANALASAFVNKGVALDSSGKLTEAIAEYDKAIGIYFDLVENQGRIELANALAKAFVNKGNALYSSGKLTEAIAEYDKAIGIYFNLVENQGRIELANDLAKAFVNKGVALYSSGKLTEAIAEYDKAIEILKDLVENQGRIELANALAKAFLNKGNAFSISGRLPEAIAEYDKAIEILKDLVENQGRIELANDLASAFVNKGVALYSSGKLTEAIAEYDKAIEILKDLVENQGRIELANDLASAFLNKGNALYSSGKLTEAIAEYDKAIGIYFNLVENQGRIELANDLASAFLNKGNALDSLGKLTEAIAEYDKAIGIYFDLVENQGRIELANYLAMAFLNKGTALEQQNNSAEAVTMFGQAVALWERDMQYGFVQNLPNLVKAYRLRGESLIKLEDWENTAVDGVNSLIYFTIFTQDENFSEYFKQQIGADFGRLLYRIKQLSNDAREKIFAAADALGQQQEQPQPFGDILREYVNRIGE